MQRVNGSLRRTNLLLAVTSYVLVLYASFLTRSGVLADFSVHSFVNLGLNGFLLSFLGCTALIGYGFVFYRLRDIPGPAQPLSRRIANPAFFGIVRIFFGFQGQNRGSISINKIKHFASCATHRRGIRPSAIVLELRHFGPQRIGISSPSISLVEIALCHRILFWHRHSVNHQPTLSPQGVRPTDRFRKLAFQALDRAI